MTCTEYVEKKFPAPPSFNGNSMSGTRPDAFPDGRADSGEAMSATFVWRGQRSFPVIACQANTSPRHLEQDHNQLARSGIEYFDI